MTSIPGTNYQVSGGNFIDPQGQQISAQDFLKKVQSKEISLTEDSLRILQDNAVGPDMLQSLRTGAGLATPLAQVMHRLDNPEGELNVTMMFATIIQTAQTSSKAMFQLGNSHSELGFEKMKAAIEKDKSAAGWKLAAGIASGVFSIASGAVSIAGATRSLDGVSKDLDRSGKQNIVGEEAFKALPEEVRNQTVLVNRELAMQIGKAQGDAVGGLGQVTTSVVGHFGTMEEQKARSLDLEAKKADHEANVVREIKNSADQLDAKVRDLLLSSLSSELETKRAMTRTA
jgi:hypothetical protein